MKNLVALLLITLSFNVYAGLGLNGNLGTGKDLSATPPKNGISLNDKDFKNISLKSSGTLKNINESQDIPLSNAKVGTPFYHLGSQPIIK
ncbi:MAG: hypothetical protein V4525_15230 [Pseudomonadota bacterium]